MKQFIVTDRMTLGSMYVFPTKEQRDKKEEELKKRFPSVTFYCGESNIFGHVQFDMPEFPK